MKKFLLIAIMIASGIAVIAQNLPVSENFNNGLPTGWSLVAANIDNYDRDVSGNCITNQGIIAGPSIGSNGNNKTGFKTAALQYVNANSFVIVRFEGYVYSGNRLRCVDQLFASTPCSAVGKIYIISAGTGDTLGSSAALPLNLTTGLNTLVAQVNATVTPATDFIVLLDVSNVNCNVNGSLRFVIDNVFINATAGGPLPVYFKSFRAVRSNQTVLLNWETATEQNNRGFHVERNTNGRWENIAFVVTKAVNGNSNIDLSYSFTDVNIVKGISQYRIVQVDFNGNTKFSEVRFVRDAQTGKNIVFPNPSFNGNTNVLFGDQNSAHDVAIVDLTGRVVKQWSNINNNSLRIDNLIPGFYSIRIYNRSSGEQVIEKLIVNKR